MLWGKINIWRDIYFQQIETKAVIYLTFLNTSQNTPDSKYPAEWQKCRERMRVQAFIKGMSDSALTNANATSSTFRRSLYHLKVLEVLMLKCLPGCDSFAWLVSKHFLSANRNRRIQYSEDIWCRSHDHQQKSIWLTERRSKPAGSRFGTIVARS